MPQFDYLIAGGGLHGGLIALALLDKEPGLRIGLIEASPRLGGNHTWCFHRLDVPEAAQAWVEPLVVKRWDRHEVVFPRHRRVMSDAYSAITSERFEQVLRQRMSDAPGCRVLTEVAVARVDGEGLTLASGERLSARQVIDARGQTPRLSTGLGYQVFFGLEVRTRKAWTPAHPLLIDATVPQEGDFRFMYVLPFADDHLLVEDTAFTEDPGIDPARARARIDRYLAEHGAEVRAEIRAESGVLPMPWADWPKAEGPALTAGFAGGFFNPATGYSLPVAVRLALAIAASAPARPEPTLKALRRSLDAQARYGRLLNRLLFRLIPPAHRWQVYEGFYHLPAATIARFYAMELTFADQARILFQRPPIAAALGIDGGAR